MSQVSSMKTIGLALGVASFGAVGCASTPPRELIDARAAYQRAASGPAQEQARSHLDTAKRALMRAEDEFDADGDSDETRDYAYIAQRLAETSEAQANLAIATREKERAERDLQVAQAENQQKTERDLAGTKQQLALSEAELNAEREARLQAERSAQEAKEQLEKVGEVKEEERGLVVSVPGSVLFTSGRSSLMPAAEEKLLVLVDALRNLKDQRIVVEGHTDSVGSETFNERLSEKRAQAVKDYLVNHGVPTDHVDVVGKGESQPVADNGTAEGRANNRRVEIVIQRATS